MRLLRHYVPRNDSVVVRRPLGVIDRLKPNKGASIFSITFGAKQKNRGLRQNQRRPRIIGANTRILILRQWPERFHKPFIRKLGIVAEVNLVIHIRVSWVLITHAQVSIRVQL